MKTIRKGGNWRHGMRYTRQYNTWNHMMFRCYHPKDSRYGSYGGRGITVCKQWHNFIGFWEDMKKGYFPEGTLERINVNGNYCKENCKWATWKEQQTNKRNTLKIQYQGKEVVLKEVCSKLSIPYDRIYQRIYIYGWTIEDAFNRKTWEKFNKTNNKNNMKIKKAATSIKKEMSSKKTLAEKKKTLISSTNQYLMGNYPACGRKIIKKSKK